MLAVGATGTGLLALKASNDLEDLRRRPETSTGAYDSAHSRMLRLSIMTDVLAGLAVATGAVALYFTFKSPSVEHPVAFSVNPRGVEILGQF